MRPLIGITCDYSSEEPKRFWLREEYASAIWEAGGFPVLLPPLERIEIHDIVTTLAGLLISGGDFDIDPSCFGETPHPKLGKLNPQRSRFELALINWAMENNLPTLGICGGVQAINVAAGGTVYQDIPSQVPKSLVHEKKRTGDAHEIQITSETLLANLVNCRQIMVNSTHHQSVKDLAPGFRISAKAPDGVVEAIESEKHPFMLGVQWHPEALYDSNPVWLNLFSGFIKAAKKNIFF